MVKSVAAHALYSLLAGLVAFNSVSATPTRSQQIAAERAEVAHALLPRTTSSTWYAGQSDPWVPFTSTFDWSPFNVWGFSGHSLSYVKEWYYAT